MVDRAGSTELRSLRAFSEVFTSQRPSERACKNGDPDVVEEYSD